MERSIIVQINSILLAIISLIILVFGLVGLITGDIPTAGTASEGISLIFILLGGLGFFLTYRLWQNSKLVKIIFIILAVIFVFTSFIDMSKGFLDLFHVLITGINLFVIVSLIIDLIKH